MNEAQINRATKALRDWYHSGQRELHWREGATSVLNAANSPHFTGLFDLPDKPFPLEIAAGERPTPGFVHHDARPLADIEVVCDMRGELLQIMGEGTATELRACHVLEHSPYPETANLLLEWKSILIDGGRLYIEVPNMEWQIQAAASGEITMDEFVYYAYGEQNYPGNFHFNGYTVQRLHDILTQVGFKEVTVDNIGQVLIAHAYKV